MLRYVTALILSLTIISSSWSQSWKYLTTNNSDLPSDAIQNILFDDDGSVWFCTQDKGLVHYVGGAYHEYNSASNDDFNADWVNAIAKGAGSVYWIATEYEGLYKYANGTFIQYKDDGAGHDLEDLREIALQKGGPDNGGAVWIGTWAHGLFKFDGSSWQYFDQASGTIPDNSVLALAVEENSDPNNYEFILWAGTNQGLVKFDGNTWQTVSIGGQTDHWINDIALKDEGPTFANGTLVVGTDWGELCLYDGSEWNIFNMADAWNPNNSVTKIAVDADGIIWFGQREEGLGMYDGKQLLSFYKDNSGIAGNYVISLAIKETNDSTEVWCSVYDNGYLGISIFTQARVTGLEANSLLPLEPILGPNYPNPFNPTTTIPFTMARRGHVTLKVYDINGRLVRVLLDDFKAAGKHLVKFDASDLAAGLYIGRLRIGDKTKQFKMILLK
jgi:ligand-binding sensor domain-containing protein